MFCKWCGNTVKATDSECPSCGRKTPPMSDCGGFYKLKHAENKSSISHTPETPPQKPTVVTKCPVIEKLEPKYARDRRAAKSHHNIMMICFFVLVLLLLLSTILTLGTRRQLKELESLILSINAEPVVVYVSEETEAESVVESTPAPTDEPKADAAEETTKKAEVESAVENSPEPTTETVSDTTENKAENKPEV